MEANRLRPDLSVVTVVTDNVASNAKRILFEDKTRNITINKTKQKTFRQFLILT